MNRLYEFLTNAGVSPAKYLYENECFYALLDLKLQNEFALYAKRDLRANSLVIRERYKLIQDVFEVIKDMDYAVIKGAVLSQSAYGNIAYRKSGDVDLFVSPKDISEFKIRLKSLGFIQGYINGGIVKALSRQEIIFHSTLTHQLAPFCRQEFGLFNKAVEIDINFNIMWGESDINMGIDRFKDGIIKEKILGNPIKKLCPIYEFIVLCLHHYKDLNSIYLLYTRGFQVKHLSDIYYYLMNHIDITPKKLFDVTQKYNVGAYVYNCIAYAFCLFDDDYLIPFLKILSNDYAQYLFQSLGLNELERQQWRIPFEKRIVSTELHKSLCEVLSAEDLKKIETNTLMMHSF